ncbi:MFS transporter [Metallosphaera cuprina]|nr:MFS transporter [Metallosphaera cuprina]
MRRFISQPLLVAGITYIGIWYPVTLYSTTNSIFLLGLATTLYNLANAAGSYLWGIILDRSERRLEFGVMLPIALTLSSFLLGRGFYEGLIAYGLIGFISAMNSPLYSLILLENYSFERVPKMNSILSQFTLVGNIVGSISAVFESSWLFPFILCFLSVPVSFVSLLGTRGKINVDKITRLKSLRGLLGALSSFAAFNFGAELFFTTFVPLNYISGNPRYLIYVSYTILYVLDEGVYYLASKLTSGKESFFMYLSIMGRALVVLSVSIILRTGTRLGQSTVSMFVLFGSFYPLYGNSFFSFMFKNIRKNRGAIIGVFNAVEDMANIAGSSTVSFLGNNINLDYLVAFYSFAFSALSLYSFISKKLPASSAE